MTTWAEVSAGKVAAVVAMVAVFIGAIVYGASKDAPVSAVHQASREAFKAYIRERTVARVCPGGLRGAVFVYEWRGRFYINYDMPVSRPIDKVC